jgi:hypothetical protein
MARHTGITLNPADFREIAGARLVFKPIVPRQPVTS